MIGFAEDAVESLTYSKTGEAKAMTDLINGRTPKEIKRRLECASFDCGAHMLEVVEYVETETDQAS